MPGKYIIKEKQVPGRFPPVPKMLVERGDNCIRCGKCVSVCIYDVHAREAADIRRMAEPVSYRCKHCFACVQSCPSGALKISIHPEYEKLGDALYTPEMMLTIMKEGETGHTPVSGGGYGGPFSGSGFDDMWTDMSEIVRPTRDGIHGREYISTAVDLGSKPPDVRDLRFDAVGNPLTHVPPNVSINLPVIFDTIPFPIMSEKLLCAVSRAATELGTMAIIDNNRVSEALDPYSSNIIPCINAEKVPWGELMNLAMKNSIVELIYFSGISGLPESLKKANSELIVMVRVNEPEDPASVTAELYNEGVDIIHLVSRMNLPSILDMAHSKLIEEKIRDRVTIIGSKGIAEAAHVPKAIILGADVVAISRPLLVALECTLCMRCAEGKSCARNIEEIPVDWGAARMKNLIAAWHNQILEILGAMGIREVSRLRGEKGRSMSADEMKQIFIMDILSGCNTVIDNAGTEALEAGQGAAR